MGDCRLDFVHELKEVPVDRSKILHQVHLRDVISDYNTSPPPDTDADG